MSWSISATGGRQAVLKSCQEQLAKITCSEPEESIKNKVGEIIEMALVGVEGGGVMVAASGSQYTPEQGKPPRNTLRFEITEIYNFAE